MIQPIETQLAKHLFRIYTTTGRQDKSQTFFLKTRRQSPTFIDRTFYGQGVKKKYVFKVNIALFSETNTNRDSGYVPGLNLIRFQFEVEVQSCNHFCEEI